MTERLVTLSKDALVGTLTLNRPEKLNALSPQLMDEFDSLVAEAASDAEIKALVIRGAGRAFSAGYDLTRGSEGETIEQDRERLQANLERWQRLRDFPKPVIAMVHGYCLAGATQLCMCADVIFVAADASVGFPSVPVGAGLLGQMWAWYVGSHRAKYLSFLAASHVTGEESERFGWATKAYPADALERETYGYARRIVKVPSDLLRIKKLAVDRVMDVRGFKTAMMFGAEWDAIAHETEGVREVRQMIREWGLSGAIQWFRER